MLTLLEKNEIVSSSPETLFVDLTDPKKYSSFFDNTFLRTDADQQVPENFQFVATMFAIEDFLHS